METTQKIPGDRLVLGMLSAFRFIRDALQVEENLSQIHKKAVAIDAEETEEIAKEETEEIAKPEAVKEFLHDEVRDKLEQIGLWLGHTYARTPVRV